MPGRIRSIALALLATWTVLALSARPVVATNPVQGLIVEPDDGREPLLAEIDSARSSIAIAVYNFTDSELVAALGRATARGVRVRVLLERHPYLGSGEPVEDRAALEAAGATVRWAPARFTFLHEKAAVFDESVALIGTMNFTPAAFSGNREFALLTTDPAAAGAALTIFEADWNGGDSPPRSGAVIASPESSRTELASLIASATVSLDLYAEVIRDQAMTGLLVDRAAAGIRVRILLPDPVEDDAWRIVDRLRAAGIEVRQLDDPYGHAKAILVDGRTLFVGSQNLTATSLDQNRELGIVTGDAGVIARLTAAFARDFAASPLAVSPFDVAPTSLAA